MANTSLGQILEIDKNTLDNIGEVSTKITAIGDSVEAASKKFQEEFGKMNTSATTLNTMLTTIKETLSAMGVDLTKPLADNLNNAATSASNAAASITDAARAMGEFGESSSKASSGMSKFNKEASEVRFEDPKLIEYKKQIDELKTKIGELQKVEKQYKDAQGAVPKNTKKFAEYQTRIDGVRDSITSLVLRLNDLNKAYDRQAFKPVQDWLEKREKEDKLQADIVARESKQLEMRIKQIQALTKQKQEKADTAALKEEQKIYSQLEKQYLRLSALKQKSVGADGLVKDAANYQKILDLMQKTEREMQKMLADNPKLKQNELAIVAARQREVEVTQKLSREQKKLNYETPKGALEFANTQVRTYQDRAQALKYLETAMRNLDTSEGKNRDTLQQLYGAQQRLRAEQEKSASIMGDMKGKIDKVTSTAKQLASTLGVVFSVQAIKGFVSKLIEVRGEFELQNTALRAILQNKDEADRLFAQVTQLAVKSPYSVRQLTSYTKQLAAYRVESDKLYETTKRLADVSSGLGVDMQRIILAFGQVKAANYLRATEVRQFTEAGINILGELSKYYTELEGHMVSVADVQERITKRMVEFGDVEEIFRRMTDAGGLFYDMQAKQAATLRGMMMNLRDSLDIMFNEIGKSTEGTLKGVVNMLTNLTRNWRDVMAFMKPFLASFVALKSAMKLYAIGMKDAGTQVMWFSKNIKNLGPQTLAVAKGLTATNMNVLGLNGGYKTLIRTMRTMQPVIMGLGRAFMAIAPVAAIAAVMALITHLRKATREAKRLDEEINKTISESVADYKKSEAELKNLVSRLHDVNTGSYEHQQIIQKLNSQYGDYIGFLVTENTTYEQMSDTLDTVIARLKEKSAYEASGKALQKAYESQTAAMDEARMQMLDAHVYVRGVQQERKLTEREVDIFLNNYEKKVRELGRELTFEEQYNVLSETLGLEISSFNFAVGGWNKINSLAQSILKTKQKELDVQNTINSRYDDQFSTVQQSLAMERLEARKRAALAEIDKKNTLSAFEREKAIQAVELSYQRDRIANELSFGMITEDTAKKRLRVLMEEPKLMASINKKFKELAEKAGFAEEEYSKLLFTNEKWEKGLTSIESQIKETWEAQGNIIEQQKRYKEQGLKYDVQELQNATKKARLYEMMADVMGITLEGEKKVEKESTATAKQQVELLKQIRQEYEQNRKVMGEEEASAFTKAQFKDNAIFKQLRKLGVINAKLNVDSTGLITSLKRLARTSTDAARKEIEAMIATLNNEQVLIDARVNTDKAKEDIEKLFDRVEITKEMDKLGIDRSIIEQLFGVDSLAVENVNDEIEKIARKYVSEMKEATKTASDYAKKYDISNIEDIGAFIRDNEGLRLTAYDDKQANADIKRIEDVIGTATIGWGHTAGLTAQDIIDKYTITIEEAEELFQEDIVKFTSELDDLLANYGITVGRKQYEALLSLAYNAGSGAVEELLKRSEGDMEKIAEIWEDNFRVTSKGEVLDGLIERREREVALYREGADEIQNLAKQTQALNDTLDASSDEFWQSLRTIVGEDTFNMFNQQMKKSAELQKKELEERLKNYSQYLKKEASVAVQAKLDEAKQLAELEATQELSEPQKEVIRTRIQEETRTKVDKAAWDQFKNTDMYIRMFEDLEFVSTSALSAMEQKLNELRTSLKNLDPQNLKEIQTQLQKIQEVKMQRNPLQAMIDALREVNDLRKEGLTLDKLEQQSATYQAQADAARNEIDTLEYIIGLRNKGMDVESEQYALEHNRYDLIDVTDDRLREQVAEQENIKKSAEANLEVTNKNIKKYSDAAKSVNTFGSAMEKLGGDIGKIFGSVNELVADITGESSDVIGVIGDISGSLGQAINSAIMLAEAFKKTGVAANSALGIIGLIATALEAVVSVVSSIASASDNRIARQIEDSERRVERLEQAYEKLDKAISDAYDLGRLRAYNAEMERNLELQKAELQGQIALYRDRKGGEAKYQSEIDDLKKQIDEIDQTLSDNIDRLTEKMGGFGGESSIASAAEGFVDAWYGAFMETGDGLDALGEKFQEFQDNLVKRQILARLGEKLLKPIMDIVNEAVDENGDAGMKLTRQELESIRATYEKYSELFNEQAKAIMEELGITPGTGAKGELSGLTEDYGQMSEATATALASINESIRYFESDSNLVLHAMHNILTVPGENPFYLTMLEQARYTREIRDAIRAMTYSVGIETGLKVRMI